MFGDHFYTKKKYKQYNVVLTWIYRADENHTAETSLGSLRKPRRRRQRQRRQTKDLMSRTIAVLVRYNSLYISLPSSAKQEREMTKFCVV